jgi:hypothetical protein
LCQYSPLFAFSFPSKQERKKRRHDPDKLSHGQSGKVEEGGEERDGG